MTSSRRRAGALALLAAAACALPASLTALPAAAAPGAVSVGAVAPPVAGPAGPLADPRADGPDAGRWQVDGLGAGRYEVSWTAPERLPLDSDRPTISGAGLAFGPSTVRDDGRTVHATVSAPEAPEPAELDVLLSGDRLDERGSDLAAAGPTAATPSPARAPLEAPDPGVAGPFATVSSDYELPGVKVPGLREPVEMVGHVVEPGPGEVTGPRPLVVFLHGRHEVCYQPGDDDGYTSTWPCAGKFEEIPSHLGYVYVQQLLASQGYATVSVRVNGINAQDFRLDDGGADARARIVRAHLDHWVTLAAEHQVDLSQVVLVGHSRGGEGVDRASIEIPLTAPYRVAGQVLLAPTDFASHTAPYVPTVTVLPYCDGDVSDIQGQKFTDTARDLAADDTSLKSSVLVMGANHNFFNTEWTPGTAVAPANDDWYGDRDEPCGRRHPGRLSAAEQRSVGQAYVAGAVRLFTGADAYLPLFDGSATTVPSTGDADVRSHAIGGGRDDRRPGLEATPTIPTGGAVNRLCTGQTTSDASAVTACGRGTDSVITPHWRSDGEAQPTRSFLEMSWETAGATGGLRFDEPLDLSSDRLELRTIVDPTRGPVDLQVRLTDGSGGSATLAPEGGPTVQPLLRAPFLTKLWAQALLVDASAAPGLDPTDVVSVELVAGDARGRIWVADLAAAPAALAPVPNVRLPQVQLGTLRIAEGDPAGGSPGRELVRTAEVPFTVTGTLTRPARFVVVTAGQARGSLERIKVDLAPGQTSGSIPVGYSVDRLDDYDTSTVIAAWPLFGVATDDYQGDLRVTDDDPEPAMRVRVPRTVREGRPILVRLSLSRRVDYEASGYYQVVKGPGPALRGADVPQAFLEQLEDDPDPTKPLFAMFVADFGTVRAGRTSAQLVLPTVRDRRREGRERVTLSVRFGDERVRRTVTVLDG